MKHQTTAPVLTDRRTIEHYAGCLLGGAVGDALGAPVEFLSLGDIRARYGAAGVTGYLETGKRRDMSRGQLALGHARLHEQHLNLRHTAVGLARAAADQW